MQRRERAHEAHMTHVRQLYGCKFQNSATAAMQAARAPYERTAAVTEKSKKNGANGRSSYLHIFRAIACIPTSNPNPLCVY